MGRPGLCPPPALPQPTERECTDARPPADDNPPGCDPAEPFETMWLHRVIGRMAFHAPRVAPPPDHPECRADLKTVRRDCTWDVVNPGSQWKLPLKTSAVGREDERAESSQDVAAFHRRFHQSC
jgi:hypothetical protein